MTNNLLYLTQFADILPLPTTPPTEVNENTILMVTYTALFFMNILSFILFSYDKHLANSQLRRIPESVLLATSILGGPYGAAMAMLLCRHKTHKLAFRIIVPVSLIIWVFLIFFFYLK